MNRPDDDTQFAGKWTVPKYIYGDDVFPNAVSGSGYVLTADLVNCIYEGGLRTRFLNLEDVFITGLAARKCDVTLKNSQWFRFMGKKSKSVTKQDILIHDVKTEEKFMELHNRVIKMYPL